MTNNEINEKFNSLPKYLIVNDRNFIPIVYKRDHDGHEFDKLEKEGIIVGRSWKGKINLDYDGEI